ncbi:MAG: hypothetical protein ACLQVL_30320 [Terriglobia bacterium]
MTLEILRDGKPLTVKVPLAENSSSLGVHPTSGTPPAQGTLPGVSVQTLTPDPRQQLGVPTDIQGLVVSNLGPSSPADQGGILQALQKPKRSTNCLNVK